MGKKKKTPPPSPKSVAQELGLPVSGVETHAHLDMEHFQEDLEEVLERARACGVAHFGQVFLGPAAYREGRPRFEQFPEAFFLLGIHPHDASGCDEASIQAMREAFAEDARLKALGETGLDHYWMHSPAEVQRAAFISQLELALELDLRVVVHSRDADDETVDILEGLGFAGRPLLWHCFGRDAAFASRLLDNGWHLSIPGPVTFPKSDALRKAVALIPLERMVLETDCPYLTPTPYRGKRNEPAYLVFTAREIAACKDVSPAEVWSQCGATARAFFGLD